MVPIVGRPFFSFSLQRKKKEGKVGCLLWKRRNKRRGVTKSAWVLTGAGRPWGSSSSLLPSDPICGNPAVIVEVTVLEIWHEATGTHVKIIIECHGCKPSSWSPRSRLDQLVPGVACRWILWIKVVEVRKGWPHLPSFAFHMSAHVVRVANINVCVLD